MKSYLILDSWSENKKLMMEEFVLYNFTLFIKYFSIIYSIVLQNNYYPEDFVVFKNIY